MAWYIEFNWLSNNFGQLPQEIIILKSINIIPKYLIHESITKIRPSIEWSLENWSKMCEASGWKKLGSNTSIPIDTWIDPLGLDLTTHSACANFLSTSSLKIKGSLVSVFKQQFLVFLEIRVGEKVYGNTCNIV